jgi:hypothetical protein
MPERFEQIKRTQTDHWSFQPVRAVQIPASEDAWINNPIDALVLRRLHQSKLAPAPMADRRTLIRRVTFDLTGLPPTPEEIAAFLEDDSPDAYERLVDRLLASPGYGERWGRHWLDVVRYADSNGLDENVAHGNAWRYRDYVVASFNADKPYALFLKEQLAGDLLPAENPEARNEKLIATGFLSLGPKVLAEVDETKMEMDIVDEQIDTFGKAFLGLTFGCARCHDHKFDPLTTEDYYALAGIFKSTNTMDSFTKIAKWHEHEIPTALEQQQKTSFDQKIKSKSQQIEEFIKAANAALLAGKEDNAKLPDKPEEQYPDDTKAQLKLLRDELAALEKTAPVLPSAMGVSDGSSTRTSGVPCSGAPGVASAAPPPLGPQARPGRLPHRLHRSAGGAGRRRHPRRGSVPRPRRLAEPPHRARHRDPHPCGLRLRQPRAGRSGRGHALSLGRGRARLAL